MIGKKREWKGICEKWAGYKGKKGIKRKKWHCSSNFKASHRIIIFGYSKPIIYYQNCNCQKDRFCM
jgi:hypothetical protein